MFQGLQEGFSFGKSPKGVCDSEEVKKHLTIYACTLFPELKFLFSKMNQHLTHHSLQK